MDEESHNEDQGPPPVPSLEEELVVNFGPNILDPSDQHMEEDDGEFEEGSFTEPSDYGDPYGPIDLTHSRPHRLSDSEEEEAEPNPLRRLIRKQLPPVRELNLFSTND
jgi:hypothetical protein